MFYLIGTGIYDEKDISLKGLEICKKAHKVYMEKYTCEIEFDFEYFEKLINKKVIVLDRDGVESGNEYILEAKKKDIVLLIPGDPLSATTHNEIVQRLRKRNIPYEIIHGSSVFSSIAETGLSLYRFGRVVSLPTPQEGYFPTTPYDYIITNKKNNLHTLLLLDIHMKANEALDILLMMEKEKNKKLFNENTEIIICAHLGGNSTIAYGSIKELKKKNFGRLPHCIIIPSKMEFYEEEFINYFKIA